MRRYEPKPWDIRRCDMIHADEGEYVLYCEARAEIERLREAIRQADDILEGCGFAVELGARRVLRAALSSTGEKG